MHGSTRGLKANQGRHYLYFLNKSTIFLEALGKGLLFWLLMLYYEGSSLDGSGLPSGIETRQCVAIRYQVAWFKRQGLPVWD